MFKPGNETKSDASAAPPRERSELRLPSSNSTKHLHPPIPPVYGRRKTPVQLYGELLGVRSHAQALTSEPGPNRRAALRAAAAAARPCRKEWRTIDVFSTIVVMTTKREAVAAYIRQKIQSGEYPAGTVLTGVGLQAEVDASRGTISNALYDLGEEGLIYSRARNTSWVVVGELSESYQSAAEVQSIIQELDEVLDRAVVLRERLVSLRVVLAREDA